MCKHNHANAAIERPKIMYKTPAREKSVVIYRNNLGEDIFLITRINGENIFTLYKICKDGLKKVGKSHSPIDLEERFNVINEMGEPND